MVEWTNAEPTVVTLAEGSTSRFRLKKGIKILLSEPAHPEGWIVPIGVGLHYAVDWKPMLHSR